MSGTPQFVDGTTALNAANLNALAPAQSFLISGTTPSTSASLVLTVPAQVVVVNPSNAPAVAVSPGSTTLTVAASSDVYIDISAAGTYTQVAVANGAAPPAVTANTLRLWKAVSSGTGITAVTLLAPGIPTALPPVWAQSTTNSLVPLTTTPATWPGLATASLILAGAGTVRLRFTASLQWNPAGSMANTITYQFTVDGSPVAPTAQASLPGSPAIQEVPLAHATFVSLAAGTHTIGVLQSGVSSSGQIANTSIGSAVLEAERVA